VASEESGCRHDITARVADLAGWQRHPDLRDRWLPK
jgi:hypothetical protein